jgi:radical SAM protein with 4Fe4S-binding SPASM domain
MRDARAEVIIVSCSLTLTLTLTFTLTRRLATPCYHGAVSEAPSPPQRAIWEVTRRCNLRCAHCLVRGGAAGVDELDRSEALGAADQLAELGVAVVSLTGGEPLLREDWADIAERLRGHGVRLRFAANGHGLDDDVLARLLEVGTESFAVSLDGPRELHDRLRRGPGRDDSGPSPFDEAVAALDRLRRSPIRSAAITTVVRQNLDALGEVQELLVAHGTSHWMVQLAHRTGRLRAARADEDGGSEARGPEPIAPDDLPRLAEFLVRAGGDRRLRLIVHNTIGYLSADEPLLRRDGAARLRGFWAGCGCGRRTIGIAPNGDVKGCANQVGAPFVVGNLRTEGLVDIWRDRARWHWLDPPRERLRGACAGCALGEICQAGCTALAYGASGELFDNPFCLRTVRARAGEERTP